MLVECEDVIIGEHDVEAIEIAGEPAHLDVIALPDDDDVVAVARQGRDRAVRHADERAGGFDDGQPQRTSARERALGGAVCRHHDGGGRDARDVLRDSDAPGLERAQDGRVVDEVAEDGEGAGVSVLKRERDGIANAETHAEMRRSQDTHTRQFTQRTLCCKVYLRSRCGRVIRHVVPRIKTQMAIEHVLPARLARWLATEPDWDRVYAEELPRVFNFFRYRIGNTADAEDLTARTFEKAWRSRHRYRLDLAGFSTWLLTIARNVAIDHLRARRPLVPIEAAASVPSALRTPEEQALQQSDADRLEELLKRLAPRERELIAFKYGAEMTNRAIARATGLSESNVGTILHRAVETLRAQW